MPKRTTTKKRNAADATERNVRASNNRDVALKKRIRLLETQMAAVLKILNQSQHR